MSVQSVSTISAARNPDVAAEAQRWVDFIVGNVFRHMHTQEADNFDDVRFKVEQANAFFFEVHAAYFSFVLSNAELFYRARQLMVDDASRDLLDQLILFRILGHLHIRLAFNTPERRAQAAHADRWRVEETGDRGLLGSLAIFHTPPEQGGIHVRCWRENVIATWLQRQYYFERAGVKIAPRPGDHIVDAGGCFGDTALAFAAAVGPTGRVYTFDPMPKHCAIIQENLAMNPELANRVIVYPLGLSEHTRAGTVPMTAQETINPGATVQDTSIPTTTLDELWGEGSVERVDFIKMDIEGSELAALKGAQEVLRAQRPRLAISLYHRPEDFFTIPLWLDNLGCDYRFYLDHYSIHHEETVLYASTET